jgi:hypothetical protein
MNYDTVKLSDNNSFYRISRISFNHSFTEALVAIEFVCFDCGHLSLYKFIRRKNRDWKRKKLINLWIS